MDHLISMYIDNELSLGEKILFVEQVYGNKPYKDDAVGLLEQEKLLRGTLNRTAPAVELKKPGIRLLPPLNRGLGWAVAACLLLLLPFLPRPDFNPQSENNPSAAAAGVLHRFVIHQQDTRQVEIAGSFTNWQNVSLVPSGQGGYWEISLELPVGEHRYTFIVDGSKYLPDPTVAARESDDFGSTNSILKVET